MRKFFFVIIILVALVFPIGNTRASSTKVTIQILPGPFTAQMQNEDGIPTLVVDDQTGSDRGWQVQIDCTCQIQRVGPLTVLSGSTPIPYWDGNTLVKDPGDGGWYTQTFAPGPGSWTITEAVGP